MTKADLTDEELLKAAAKAAGYCVSFKEEMSLKEAEGTYYLHDRGYPREQRDGSHWWNPLLDDGDALRLAMELSMNLVITCNSPSLPLGVTDARSTESGWSTESHAMCPYAATRRAIVRAAALIEECRE